MTNFKFSNIFTSLKYAPKEQDQIGGILSMPGETNYVWNAKLINIAVEKSLFAWTMGVFDLKSAYLISVTNFQASEIGYPLSLNLDVPDSTIQIMTKS